MKKKISKWKKNRQKRLHNKKTNTKLKFLVFILFIFLILFSILNKNHILNKFLFATNMSQTKSEEFNKIKNYPNVKIRFSEFDNR